MKIKYFLNRLYINHLKDSMFDSFLWGKKYNRDHFLKVNCTFEMIDRIILKYSPSNFNRVAPKLKFILKYKLNKNEFK